MMALAAALPLVNRSVIEQVSDGTRLLAKSGARIFNHYHFYAALRT